MATIRRFTCSNLTIFQSLFYRRSHNVKAKSFKFLSSHSAESDKRFEKIPLNGTVSENERITKGQKRQTLLSRQSLKIKGERLKNRLDHAKMMFRDRVYIIRRENIWTVPNILCFTRIAVCPVLGYTIIEGQYGTALSIFIVAGLSDVFDGYIARNFKSQSTVLGSLIDPLADKLLIGTTFVSLTYAELIPTPLTFIVMGRDVLLTSAALYLRFLSLPNPKSMTDYFDPSLPTVRVKPSNISKFNTMVQIFTATASLIVPVFDLIGDASNLFLIGMWWTTAATTVASFVSYIRSSSSAYKLLRKTNRTSPSRFGG